jgi:hypothetical protein
VFEWAWNAGTSMQSEPRAVYYPEKDYWRLAVWDDGGERGRPINGYFSVTLNFPEGVYFVSLYNYDYERDSRESVQYILSDAEGTELLTTTVSGTVLDEGVYEVYQVTVPPEGGSLIIQVLNDAGYPVNINTLLAGIFIDELDGGGGGDPPEDCLPCEGRVTQLTLKYLGEEAAEVKVKQKKGELVFSGTVQPGEEFTVTGQDKHGTLSPEIYLYIDGEPNAKIHTSCSQPIGPGLVAGLFEVIEGYSRVNGLLCPIEEEPPPPPSSECGCEGKVRELTLRYLGETSAEVEVHQKRGRSVFDETVLPGEEFTVYGTDKKGTLGTEIYLFIDGDLNAKIHTSCSQPIGPGLVKGLFEVVSGYDRFGMELCPFTVP